MNPIRALQMLSAAELALRRIDPPAPPDPGEVRLKVRFVGINHIDVFGLRPGDTPELTYKISAAELICCNDCYPMESNDEKSWRWLGPRARSRLGVSCPLPGNYSFTVNAIGSTASDRLAKCRVVVEGREVRTLTAGLPDGTIQFFAYLDPSDYQGYLEIDLVIEGFRPPAGSDSRTLRLCIDSIEVSPWR